MVPLLLSVDVGDGRSVAGLSKAIQLSVAPVFLFTGVTGLLSLFSSRLARIIDRTRVIQEARAGRRRNPILRTATGWSRCWRCSGAAPS